MSFKSTFFEVCFTSCVIILPGFPPVVSTHASSNNREFSPRASYCPQEFLKRHHFRPFPVQRNSSLYCIILHL